MSLIKTKNISFTRDNNKILDDISVEINKGDFLTIVGISGSGKSTFLKMCGDLISPDTGNLYYEGKDYLEWNPYDLRKKISYLFQTPSFFFGNVYENLAYPFVLRKDQPDKRRIVELIKKVNLKEEILEQQITNLSGGEKQRISLIRSIIYLPEVLLLDEVTSALDQENTLIVEKLINEVHESGVTIVWVTHNQDQSRKYAGRIFKFQEGKVKEESLL